MITFEQAKESAKTALGPLYKEPKSRDEVLEHPHWWFFTPQSNEGCRGAIVDKEDGHASLFGSAMAFEMQVWGHEHGFRYDTCDLVIQEIFDYQQTLHFLTGLKLHRVGVDRDPNDISDEADVARRLRSLPCVFPNQRLALALRVPAFPEIYDSPFFRYQLTNGRKYALPK